MHSPGATQLTPKPEMRLNFNTPWNAPQQHPTRSLGWSTTALPILVSSPSIVPHSQSPVKPPATTAATAASQQVIAHKNMSAIDKFTERLDLFERQFYKITFAKLTSISPADRQENGMSFVQSGFFLLLTLMVLSKEVDPATRAEIDQCIGFKITDMERVDLVKRLISTLPSTSDTLTVRHASRLMLWPGRHEPRFQDGAAAALMLNVEHFNGTETSDAIATILNKKVELDSGGAIHDTFDEGDVSGGMVAVFMTTLYMRGRWRASPTVLNGTQPFHDADDAPQRTVRMIRINDIMKYADLQDWDAQALEISYATPGLTLLMLVPRSNSLKKLAQHVSDTSIANIMSKMKTMRVAATIPIYTLRMTLLLPNKLQAMGMPRLVDVGNVTGTPSLRLSHAVQRVMFWAEAGRDAYKDDGIEWDQKPELEVIANRPYIFFVRWRNVTLMNGNFVL
ncbi:serpin B12 isoform X2 [Spodoptera frugiperda]|nr:serpin B12 isoform X2 [Spodoptera frugiperda]